LQGKANNPKIVQMNISKILSIAFAPQITPIYWFVILYFKNVKVICNSTNKFLD